MRSKRSNSHLQPRSDIDLLRLPSCMPMPSLPTLGTEQHLMMSQANFPINHPSWMSLLEERGITEEEDREEVAL